MTKCLLTECLALSLLLIAAAAPAFAADTAVLQTACRSDFQALCKGTKPGGGRIIACLQKHSDKLSDGCRAALQAQ